MSELQAILAAYAAIGEPAFLATVVQTSGSTYRRAGARSLIMASGQAVGLISGGCLEADIFEQTQQRMSHGNPILVTYDNTAAEDILWGFGLGCNGVVQVLIEPLNPTDRLNPLRFIHDCFERQSSGAMATVIEAATVSLGARLYLHSDGTVLHGIEDQQLRSQILTDLHSALNKQKPSIKCYADAKVLIEPIRLPRSLTIFGAGQDAVPVVQFAKQLGWTVTIVDCRANAASYDRFTTADQIHLTRREKLNQLKITDQTIAIVMTHNYLDDVEILRVLLQSPACYIGVLGSKQRIERLLTELSSTLDFDRNRLYAPIGLDLGAETPEEIALAMLAEIQAVLNHRPGQSLKYCTGSIHNAAKSTVTSWADHSSSRSLNANGNAETVVAARAKWSPQSCDRNCFSVPVQEVDKM